MTISHAVVRRRCRAVLLVVALIGSTLTVAAPAEIASPGRHYTPLVVRGARVAHGPSVPVMHGGDILTPTDLRAAYQVPGTSITTTIGVVDAYDDPAVESNLAVYRDNFGLPACSRANGCLTVVNQTGGPDLPAPNANWATETDLDVQMVSAVCPSCHILLVEASDDGYGLDQAVAYAAAHADYVSMSWGATEDGRPNDHIPALATRGKVFTAASGDAGYGGDSPGYPATDPNVVAVGGTTLSYSGGLWRDTVWNNAYGASGSGCSLHEPQPWWQAAVPRITAACSNRFDNDVAIVADPRVGVAIYSGGSWLRSGGTSAGAPLIAALYAIANGGARPSTVVTGPQTAYLHPSAFRDVASGTDGVCSPALLCTATVGYDGPSGLGVPAGVAGFRSVGIRSLAGAATITRPAGTVAYGRKVTLRGVLADKGTGARRAGIPVLLQARTTGAWQTVRSVRSSSTGKVSAVLAPKRTTRYRWYAGVSAAANTVHQAAVSATAVVTVKIAKGGARVTGVTRVGHRVRVKVAGWGPRTVKYRFVWYAGSKRVATGRTVRVKAKWDGKRLRVQVTARASGLKAVSVRTKPRRVAK